MFEKNNLVFSLYQENVLLSEKFMNGNLSGEQIDIRPILPKNIGKLQKVLSKTSYNTKIDVGNDKVYDLLNHTQSFITSFPEGLGEEFLYDPIPTTKEVGDWKMSGVECKISLLFNNKLVVERYFYVKGFNPNSRYSTDLIDVVNEFCEDIEKLVKWIVINYMWEEFERVIKQEEYEKSLNN